MIKEQEAAVADSLRSTVGVSQNPQVIGVAPTTQDQFSAANGVYTGTGDAKSGRNFLNKWSALAAFAVVFGGIGSYMLFGSKADVLPNGDIFTGGAWLAADGGSITPQALPSGVDPKVQSISASSDGSRIAYYSKADNKVTIIDAKTATKQISFDFPTTYENTVTLRWSPDSTKILVAGDAVFDAITGANVNTIGLGNNFIKVDWKDSNNLVYLQNEDASKANRLCTLPFDQKKTDAQCIDTAAFSSAAAWVQDLSASTDGTKVVIVAGGVIYTMFTDGSQLAKLPQQIGLNGGGISRAVWSHDGTSIAYALGYFSTYTISADGSNAKQIGSNGGLNLDWPSRPVGWVAPPAPVASAPIPQTAGTLRSVTSQAAQDFAVSPVDKSTVVYLSTSTTYPPVSTLKSANVDFSNLKTVFTLPTLPGSDSWNFYGWSPDGKWLLFSKYINNSTLSSTGFVYEFWKSAPNGTGLTKMFTKEFETNTGPNTGAWGGDSASIQYLVRRSDGTGSVVLCKQRIDGANNTCQSLSGLQGVALNTRFSSDGKYVAFTAGALNTPGKMYVVDTNTFSVVYTKDLSTSYAGTAERIKSIAWAPDSSRVAFTSCQYSSSSYCVSGTNKAYKMNPNGSSLALASEDVANDSYIVWQSKPSMRTIPEIVGVWSDGALAYDYNIGVVNGNSSTPKFQGVKSIIGSGWSTFVRLAIGDINGDGRDDMAGVKADGTLLYYPNTTKFYPPFATSLKIGSGWTTFTKLALADMNGDGRADAVGMKSDGTLWYYANKGSDTAPFSTSAKIGSGWTIYAKILFADINGDRKAEAIGVKSDGTLWYYLNSGSSTAPYSTAKQIGSGWGAYNHVIAADENGDGKADLLGIKNVDRSIRFYPNTGSTTAPYSTATVVGTVYPGYVTLLAGSLN